MHWHHVLYSLAAYSNIGPASVYLTIMILTISGLELPRVARRGARNFFFGCLSTHLLMSLMMLLMLETEHSLYFGIVAFLMLLVNIQQTIGGWAFVLDVAAKKIRVIRFRPITDESEEDSG
jgi:hypothetical protein